MAGERAYLDWNATAPLRADARRASCDALDLVGNPSSVHREGRAARASLEKARAAVADLVGAEPAQVVFTSGATEAASHVLTPDFRMGKAPLAVSRLYAGATEHSCVLEAGRFAAGDLATVPVDGDGLLDMARLAALLAAHDDSAGLPMVAVQLVNNETGVIQPVAAIAEIVRAHKGILVVDAVQAAGRIPVSIGELGADFLFLSSHKIGGPKGAGALVSAGEIMMPAPILRGGGQEKGHRAGTENLPAIVGFGAAACAAAGEVASFGRDVGAMRDRLEAEMTAIAGDVTIHGRNAPRIANTTFFSLPGLKAETGLIAFDLEGVALSAGSACSSGKVSQSHVLAAMGRDARHGALRVSLGKTTAANELDRFVAAFARISGRRRMPDSKVETAA